jgi:hypothetical protein
MSPFSSSLSYMLYHWRGRISARGSVPTHSARCDPLPCILECSAFGAIRSVVPNGDLARLLACEQVLVDVCLLTRSQSWIG